MSINKTLNSYQWYYCNFKTFFIFFIFSNKFFTKQFKRRIIFIYFIFDFRHEFLTSLKYFLIISFPSKFINFEIIMLFSIIWILFIALLFIFIFWFFIIIYYLSYWINIFNFLNDKSLFCKLDEFTFLMAVYFLLYCCLNLFPLN